MKLKINVRYQEEYSRSELLMRSLLGWLYMIAPHGFCLFFIGIWTQFLSFLSFWIILFTGRFPEGMFNTIVRTMRWNWRVQARMNNLCDGYPAFGLDADDDNTEFDVPYPEMISRGSVIVRALFGWLYVGLPHSICLYFRLIVSSFISMLAFFIVLFTGRFPQGMHDFIVGTYRWSSRISCYVMYLTQDYPPFCGKQDEDTV